MTFRCENCTNPIDTEQYIQLSEKSKYYEKGHYIIEKSCEARIKSDYDKVEIVDSTEDLLLIRVWNNGNGDKK